MENDLLSVIHTVENLLGRASSLIEVISFKREEVRRLLLDIWSPIFRADIEINFADEETDYDNDVLPMITTDGKVSYFIHHTEECCSELFQHSISALLLDVGDAEREVRAYFAYASHTMQPRQ